MHQATGIPQDIIDRAAALSAKPTAIQELETLMNKLSGIYNDVDNCLKEIDTLLKVRHIIYTCNILFLYADDSALFPQSFNILVCMNVLFLQKLLRTELFCIA